MTVLSKLISPLITYWRNRQPLLEVMTACRWSIAIILLGGAGLLLIGQGREAAIRAGSDWGYMFFALVGTMAWALQSWLWARLSLEKIDNKLPDSGTLTCRQNLCKQFPRLLGSTAYAVALLAFVIAAWNSDFSLRFVVLIASDVIVGVYFYGLMKFRRNDKAGNSLERFLYRITKPALTGFKAFLSWIIDHSGHYSLVFLILAAFFPVQFGFFFGSIGVIFWGLSAIVVVGSQLSIYLHSLSNNNGYSRLHIPCWLCVVLFAVVLLWTKKFFDWQGVGILVGAMLLAIAARWFLNLKLCDALKDSLPDNKPFPVMTVLLVLALIFSSFNINDNHTIATLEAKPTPISMDDYTQAWQEQAPTLTDGNKPMVVVAASGGGIRAAYWTAAVLAGITDIYPGFRNALYGISGVSGGSLGAAVYSVVLREEGRGCESLPAENRQTCLQDIALTALQQDFLAPVMASMVGPDLIQRFLPVPVMALPIFPVHDRAYALAAGWQQGLTSSVGRLRTKGLDAAFSQTAGMKPEGWQPALLLNATHVETGKRVIASNIGLKRVADAFYGAFDLSTLLEQDVTLGAAVLNSARFTYASPPGTLPCAHHPWHADRPCENGHVVDGGYFENFGAVTAQQLLSAASHVANVKPLAILITNDSSLSAHDLIEQNEPKPVKPAQFFANETIGPLRALFNTESAHGIYAAKSLRAQYKNEQHDRFFHFWIQPDGDVPNPALGWVLSEQSEHFMSKHLICNNNNRKELKRLLIALDADSSLIDKYSTTVEEDVDCGNASKR